MSRYVPGQRTGGSRASASAAGCGSIMFKQPSVTFQVR